MSYELEPSSEVRALPAGRALAVSNESSMAREPLLRDERSRSSRRVTRALIAVVAALAVAWIGYETFFAPKDDRLAWTPPAGLTREETPHWLQTLCADDSRELCAAAERARNASDCEAMRAALRSLEAVDRKLSARGATSSRQHWVLVELYGQGHELCEFQPARRPGQDAK
jgi:hypothetical protein